MDWSFGNMAPDSHPPETAITPGVVVGGRYRVDRELGGGAQGQVFRADDLQLGRPVAIKLLKSNSETTRERFLREGRLTASLAHPNVVRLLAGGLTQNGRPFWVLELLDDPVDLDDYVRDKPLAERLRLFVDVCRGVGAAHAAGIVHRDLKPSNLLVDRHGHVRVVDFGLSVHTQDSADLTQSNTVVGTPLYMPPEALIESRLTRSPQQDVWSLGVLLYQLLTDELPFRCTTLSELYSQMTSAVRAPSSRVRVTPELERVCLRCLRVAPEERYPDAVSLAAALQGVRALRAREVPWLGLGFVAAVALGGLGAWGLMRPDRVPPPGPGPGTKTGQPSVTPPYPWPASDADYLSDLQRALETPDVPRLQLMIEAGIERGHPDAHYARGELLARGLAGPADPEAALEEYRIAVRGGSHQGMVALARAQLAEPGPDAQVREAIQLFKRAAELGSAEASAELGELHLLGRYGAKKDFALAEHYLLSASEIPRAAFWLGKLFYSRSDPVEGDRWVRRAAERRHPQAMYELAVTLLEREQNVEGLEWLRRSAEAGWHQAEVRMAALYLDGTVVPHSLELAWDWVERAATHSALGTYNLGVFYEKGYGREVDAAKARELFLQAAEGGEVTAMAKCFHVLSEGRGGPINMAGAHRWLQRAAEHGHPPAQKLLGKRIMFGQAPTSEALTPRERLERALPWLSQAARRDDPEAWYTLAYCLARLGRRAEATQLFRRACTADYVPAYATLGELLCTEGEGQDPVQALRFFRQAARHGQPRGYLGVGRLLEGEYGQPPDYVGAREAYEDAVALGSQGAMYRLARLLATERGGPPDPERGRALLEQALATERAAADRDPTFVQALEETLETYPELPE